MSGPACGCEEHNEARRREVIFMKKAYQLQSKKLNSYQPDFDKKHCSCPSYSCCIQRKNDDAMYGKYSYEGLTPEEARRLAEYEKQIRNPWQAYTAKLPFRLNPTLDNL